MNLTKNLTFESFGRPWPGTFISIATGTSSMGGARIDGEWNDATSYTYKKILKDLEPFIYNLKRDFDFMVVVQGLKNQQRMLDLLNQLDLTFITSDLGIQVNHEFR